MVQAPPRLEPALVQPMEETQAEDASPHFVVVIGKKGFRRLHRRGGCGVSAIEVGQSELCWSLQGLAYDLACRHCWKRGEATVSEAEEADDSDDSDGTVNVAAAAVAPFALPSFGDLPLSDFCALCAFCLHMAAEAGTLESILKKAEPALRYHMDEAGVSAETQKKVYEQGIVCLRTFAGLEEDRKSVRAVLQSDFGLHPAGNLAMRSDIALLLCVWESARTQLSVQEKNRQESKLGSQAWPPEGS
eukprot:s2055_g16.t1